MSAQTDSRDFPDTRFTDTDDFLDGGPPGLEPGEVLTPGYEVIAHLHRSNSFDVYDAWSKTRACRCIIKTPIPDKLEKKGVTSSLLREGRLLKSLTHPHIARIYEVIKEPRPAIVLETLTGETLSHLIKTRTHRLPLHDLAHLGSHLCSAVHYLHHNDILHLDLKPSNIVSERGMAKILDLSIARKPGRGKKGVGTYYYLSPEQARGDVFGPAADVWGIGAVLFEATTGKPPFNADADIDTGDYTPTDSTEEKEDEYEQLLRRVDPINRHRRVPKTFAKIIEDCLEPESDERPTVDEVFKRLEKFVGIETPF